MLFYSVFIQNIGIEEPADWEKRFDMSNADSRRVGSSMPIFLFFDVVEKVFFLHLRQSYVEVRIRRVLL